jgi:outer membrane protein assembly factor BamA
VLILYRVNLGVRRSVEKVSIAGNRYFDSATLEDLLTVHTANPLNRHGDYSQGIVAADIGALEDVYRNNGFSAVKVTSKVNAEDPRLPAAPHRTSAPLTVTYQIEEGSQQRVGQVHLEGNEHVASEKLALLLNTTAGQLYSPHLLALDRDALLTQYLSLGFDQARVDVVPQLEAANPAMIDVSFKIDEGKQLFVRNLLVTGLTHTHADALERAFTLHKGDPLNQSALTQTQRNLYDFALFNEVNTAIVNPAGGDTHKTVLIQIAEARRWVFTYGLGFEAQTGQPQNNCAGIIASGEPCNPEGKTGVSPRVLGDLTRNDLFGRQMSASLQGNYGLLEQKIDLPFQIPRSTATATSVSPSRAATPTART